MSEGVAEVLDDDDHVFVDILHSFGVQRNVAKVITHLAVAGEATSREIEHGSDMRLSEVSIAMRTLRRENWVREWEIKNSGGIGRPSKVYALSTPIDEIIRHIEEEQTKESAKTAESIQRLKYLASI